MGVTNTTTKLGLSQFTATDKPKWLGDYNLDMQKIDDFLKVLAELHTVMQADETHFSVATIKVVSAGTGYAVGNNLVANGVSFQPSEVGANGELIDGKITFDNSAVYDTDPRGTNLAVSGGTGTGATVTITTRYAVGNNVTNGELENVPESDPLVQASRLRGYVASELAKLFPLTRANLTDAIINGMKLDNNIIQMVGGTVNRDVNGNYILTVNASGGGNSLKIRTLAASEVCNLSLARSNYASNANTSLAEIDWGDGTANSTVTLTANAGTATHTYANAGTYDVKITYLDILGNITDATIIVDPDKTATNDYYPNESVDTDII